MREPLASLQRAYAANERKRPTQVHEALLEMGDEMGLTMNWFISVRVENMGLLSLVSYEPTTAVVLKYSTVCAWVCTRVRVTGNMTRIRPRTHFRLHT